MGIYIIQIEFERPDVVLPVDPGEDGGLCVLLPEVSAESTDGDQVEALPRRALHLAEGARLGVGAQATLLVRRVAPWGRWKCFWF